MTTQAKSEKPAKSKAVAKASPSTAIAVIDEQQLANEAALLKQQINIGGGNKIKIEVTGEFKLPEGMSLGNEIRVAIVDFRSRNFFYGTKYNPNNLVPPDCYAIGQIKSQMAPAEDSPVPQSDNCAGCALNAFGSGDGNGKACQNRYWVAVLLEDPENPDSLSDPDAPIYILDLSPINNKSFEGALAKVTQSMGHWVKALYTVAAENAGTYAKVSWGLPVPNPAVASCLARRAEVTDQLERGPDFAAAAAKAAASAPKSRAPSRAAPARRR